MGFWFLVYNTQKINVKETTEFLQITLVNLFEQVKIAWGKMLYSKSLASKESWVLWLKEGVGRPGPVPVDWFGHL